MYRVYNHVLYEPCVVGVRSDRSKCLRPVFGKLRNDYVGLQIMTATNQFILNTKVFTELLKSQMMIASLIIKRETSS